MNSSGSSVALETYPSTNFVFVRVLISESGVPSVVKYSANYFGSPINVPNYVPNVTDVKIPLNPGYLSLSLPPKMNLTYLVFSYDVSWLAT